MKVISLVLILVLCGSCFTSNTIIESKLPTLKTNEVVLTGKWTNNLDKYSIYIEDELEKMVISTGCEIIAANFKKYSPAITFSNIIVTQNTCNQSSSYLVNVLKQTTFVKNIDSQKIGFYNEKNEELIILSKN